MVIALSRSAACMFNSLGIKSVYVHNFIGNEILNVCNQQKAYPFQDIDVIWVGRMCDQKQPIIALKSLKLLHDKIPGMKA